MAVPPNTASVPLEMGPIPSVPRRNGDLQTSPDASRATSFSSISMEEIPQFIHPDAPGRKRSQGISVNSDMSVSSSIPRSGSVDYHPASYPTRPSVSKPSASKSEAISASEDEVESALNPTPDRMAAEEQRRKVKEVKVVRRRPTKRGVGSATSPGSVASKRKPADASRVQTIKKSTKNHLSEPLASSSLNEPKEPKEPNLSDRFAYTTMKDYQLSGDSSGDSDDSSREPVNPLSSREPEPALGVSRAPRVSETSESLPARIHHADSIDSTMTSHSVIVKRPHASQKSRRQAIEQFVTDVETELRSLRESYDAAYERCERTLRDTQHVQTM